MPSLTTPSKCLGLSPNLEILFKFTPKERNILHLVEGHGWRKLYKPCRPHGFKQKNGSFNKEVSSQRPVVSHLSNLRLRAGLPQGHLNPLPSYWLSQSFPHPEKDYQDLCRHFWFCSWHLVKLAAINEINAGVREFCLLAFCCHWKYLENIRTRCASLSLGIYWEESKAIN